MKSIGEESWLTMKVDWWWKLIKFGFWWRTTLVVKSLSDEISSLNMFRFPMSDLLLPGWLPGCQPSTRPAVSTSWRPPRPSWRRTRTWTWGRSWTQTCSRLRSRLRSRRSQSLNNDLMVLVTKDWFKIPQSYIQLPHLSKNHQFGPKMVQFLVKFGNKWCDVW